MYCSKKMRTDSKWYVAILVAILTTCIVGCDKLGFMDAKKGTSVGYEQKFQLTPQQIQQQLNAATNGKSGGTAGNTRIINNWVERNALAATIASQPGFDSTGIEAKLHNQRVEMIINAYMESQLKDAVSDETVEDYYQKNIERYTKRRIKVAHILQRIEPNAEENIIKSKEEKANELLSRVNNGEAFAQLAKDYSDDKMTAAKGGELDWLSSGNGRSELFEAALNQSKDKIPFSVVRTAIGFHVLQILEGPEEEKTPLEQIKKRIAYDLKYQKRLTLLEELKTKAKNKMQKDMQAYTARR
jgi:hypothetical protein